ncbi:MAG: hypothetical protein HZC22_07580 [Rhodocyclales bacterium]|nr:hypothetical protein [Rhodocyclales bacterium]
MSNDKSIIEKMPPWVIGVAIIAVVIFISLLFFSQNPFACSRDSDGFSCGFIREPTVIYEKLHGYFYDWDETGNTYCSHEILDLGFVDDEVSITARATGAVKNRDGNLVENKWMFRGYKHGNNLAIAYVTERPPRTGNGVYYLIQNQGEYAGFWMGVDSPSGKTIRCPYVLTTTEKRGNESCELRWPHIFSPTNGCYEIVFPSNGQPNSQSSRDLPRK